MRKYVIIEACATASSVLLGELAQLKVSDGKPCNSYKTALLDMLSKAMQRMNSHKWDENGLSFIVHYCGLAKAKQVKTYEELVELVFQAEEGDNHVSSKEIVAMQINTKGSEFIWRITKVDVCVDIDNEKSCAE